jgi:hypothetical protein
MNLVVALNSIALIIISLACLPERVVSLENAPCPKPLQRQEWFVFLVASPLANTLILFQEDARYTTKATIHRSCTMLATTPRQKFI